MIQRITTTALLLVLLSASAPTAAFGQSPAHADPGRPTAGVELMHPTLGQLRPLRGHIVRITLTDGKQIHARLLSAWPGVLRVAFEDGRTGAMARRRIRSVTYLGARFTPPATRDAADSGKLLMFLGLGLTVGGLVLGGGAAPPLFYVGNRYECPGILDCVPPATTAAVFVTALSASALAAGVPLWIAGVVRRKVHGRTGAAARRARRIYRSWGMGLTIAGAAMAGIGAGLFGWGMSDTQRLDGVRWAGAVVGSLGVFVSLCIGLPMWVEATRKGPDSTKAAGAHAARRRHVLQDAHHIRAWSTQHRTAVSGATFAYGWRF